MANKRDAGHNWHVIGDYVGDIDRREMDDMEVGREGGGVEEVVLGGGGFGGDDEEADVEVVDDDEALGKFQERDDVAHAGAWEDGYVGFYGFINHNLHD